MRIPWICDLQSACGCVVLAVPMAWLAMVSAAAEAARWAHDASGNVLARQSLADTAPEIIGHPQAQIVQSGDLASFSVVLKDPRGATFQWRFGAVDLGGETNDTLLRANVSAAHEGLYSVVVTNAFGTVTSSAARLYLDSDRDGLPDSWEITYFNSLTFQRSGGDLDGDGSSNLDEFLDGTHPNNASSVQFRLTLLGDGGSISAVPAKLKYNPGEVVTLTATPDQSNAFLGWSGDVSTLSNPMPLTMDADKTVRAHFECEPLPAGIVAFWRGETDASDLVGGQHGQFFDGGTPVGPSITATGKVGGAFVFNSAVHARVPDSADLKPPQLTLEAWVYPLPGAPSGFQTILARGSSTGADGAWWIELFHGTPRFWTKHEGSGMDVLQVSVVPMNQWSHLAASFDGATKRLYINGALVAAVGGLGALVYDPAALPVTIGGNWMNNGPAQGFTGRVDEACLYNRALEDAEVASIYRADFVGKCLTMPSITSRARLPDAIPGLVYAHQVTAALGAAPRTFALSAGAPPPGLAFPAAGLLHGTPTTPGSYSFAVIVTDANGFSTEQVCQLLVRSSTAPPGLVGWWRAENDAQDAAGTHHGTLINGPAFGLGKVGQGFALDGIDDSIVIADAPALRPASLTLEAWVRFNVTSGIQVIGAKPLGNGNLDSFVLYMDNGTLAAVRADALGDGPYLSKSFAPVVGNWYHVAYTFDDTSKRQALYIDGVLVASGLTPRSIGYDGQPLLLGRDSESGVPSYFMKGTIDEASLYRRALDAAEIAAIYNVGAVGKTSVGPYINEPGPLPIGKVGQAYSQAFSAIRATDPVVFSVAEGALPSGLTLSPAGLLSGTPTAHGHFSFTARAAEGAGLATDQPRSLRVVPHVPPPSGVVAWWRAEGNPDDAIGANDGGLRNGTTFVQGKVGQAFSLDGTDDSFDIPDTPALRPTSLTLETWVWFDATNGVRHVFAKPLGGGNLDSFGMFLNTGTLVAFVSDASGNGPTLGSPSALLGGRWYHVAYTFDDLSKQQILYVNGVEVARGLSNKSIGYDNQPVLLGRDTESGVPSYFLGGRLDEAAIYDRALGASEIASIYDADLAGKVSTGPRFTTSPVLPDAHLGQVYGQTMTSAGGTLPVAYELRGGIFPPGLTLSAAGALSGTPLRNGSFPFTVRVTDGSGGYADQLFGLFVFNQIAPPAGLVAWWRAENDAMDAAGTNNGTLSNGVAFAPGRTGQAFSLDGVNDSIDIPDAPALRPNSVTLMAWVTFHGTSGIRNTIFAKPVGPTGPRESYTLYFEPEHFRLRGAVGDATSMGVPVSTSFSPVLGRWYHLAYTFDEASRQQALYIDGVPAVNGVGDVSIGYDTQSLLLGRDNVSGPGPFYFFRGRIDEAAVYRRALSAVEIGLVFATGSYGKRPLTLFERWKLAHLGEASLSDSSDLDRDGYSALLEYGLNLSPTAAEFGGLPELVIHEYPGGVSRLRAIFQRNPTRTDIDIEVQGASSLGGPWERLALSIGGAPMQGVGYVGGDGPGLEPKTVEVRDTQSLSDAVRRFLKVTVSRAPTN